MSDFILADNHYRQVVPLFADSAENSAILFSEYLAVLARLRPVRIITTVTATSRNFLESTVLRNAGTSIVARLATSDYHEKGILAPHFYIEGSMNVTHSGVYVRDEKVTYHASSDDATADKIARAYLEFDRRWDALGNRGVMRE